MKKYIIFGLILGLSLIWQPAQAQTQGILLSGGYCFTTNMQLGSRGQLVQELQKVLNKDNETRVAPSGAGSVGNETTYFGPATRAAVMKFQAKYKAEVLTPAGLTNPTGFVGALTRAKMNAFSGCGQAAQTPKINEINPISGKIGTRVAITGQYFTNESTITFGQRIIPSSEIRKTLLASGPAVDGLGTLEFTIPEWETPGCAATAYTILPCLAPVQQLTPGTYTVRVSNGNKSSNEVSFKVLPPDQLSISLTTNDDVYYEGEDINITVTATNNSSRSKKLNFNSGCQADYSITPGPQHTAVCTQALTSVTIRAGESKSWMFTATDDLAVGTYVVEGVVFGYGSLSQTITVASGTVGETGLEIRTPNGGEDWEYADKETISWVYGSLTPLPLDITLLNYLPPCISSSACPLYAQPTYTIAKNVSGTSYRWTVGNLVEKIKIPEGKYLLRACAVGNTDVVICDTSDSYFTIKD